MFRRLSALDRLWPGVAHQRAARLTVRGTIGTENREFLFGVGEGAHAKHQFRPGNTLSGDALPVADLRTETAEFYEVSDLQVTGHQVGEETQPLRGGVFHHRFRSTANVVIADLRREYPRRNARTAFGDARWQSR
jgi:hypothetical protein